jgi:hypothetical protein
MAAVFPGYAFRRLPLVPLVLLAFALGGCMSAPEWEARVYSVQGKYDYMTCPELAGNVTTTRKSIVELETAMAKADRDPAGIVINATVYAAPLAQARANLQLLQETQVEKKCPELLAPGSRKR